MRLLDRYSAALQQGDIVEDACQREVVESLQRIQEALAAPRWWFQKPISGAYVYGPVGVGKTYLMDLFYASVEQKNKARFHFHHFMQYIDAQLCEVQGQSDPVRRIAVRIAQKAQLLCLDEFFVDDVAHALILAELLKVLFSKGVVLVTTANVPMDDLYLKGLHRERFLPAIALLKQQCTEIFLTEDRDYRLGRAPRLGQVYFYPLNKTTTQTFAAAFSMIVPAPQGPGDLLIQNRPVPCLHWGIREVWFAFDVLCNVPRCSRDYLEIADRFDLVFLSDVPAFSEKDTLRVLLFIHLVDVLYDRGVALVMSAAVPLQALYLHGESLQLFQRTLSRLYEMQSADFIQRHPRLSGNV